MAKARRKLQAFKWKLEYPVKWMLRRDRRVVFYEVETLDEVTTPDGDMLCVKLRHNVELANPDADVAVLVGQAVRWVKSNAVVDPQSPELWFWRDKFWIKAKASAGHEYYNNKSYLWYEVEVVDAEGLLSQTCTGYEIPDPPEAPKQ